MQKVLVVVAKKIPWFYEDADGEGHLTYGQEAQPFGTLLLTQVEKHSISIFHKRR